jgi:hypothetical protein
MGSSPRTGRIGRRVIGALAERQTYKNLLYLLLAIPLGFLYYFVFGFGVFFGLLLILVLVGVVLLVVTLVGARIAAGIERRLANALLGLDLERYDDIDTSGSTDTRSRLRAYVDAPSTWRAVGFLSIKTLVSVVALFGVIAFASILELVLVPLRYPTTANFGELNGEPLVWSVDTVPEAALAGALGAVLLLVFVHVANAVAYVCGRISAALLGEPTTSR